MFGLTQVCVALLHSAAALCPAAGDAAGADVVVVVVVVDLSSSGYGQPY